MTATLQTAGCSTMVSTLLCHRDVGTGVQCLKSVSTQCNVRLQIFDDGSITQDDAALLSDALPGSRIVSKEESVDIVSDHIQRRPSCQQYWTENLFRAKTFAIPLLSSDDIRYIDSDILFFRPCPSAFSRSAYGCDAVFMKDIKEAYSVRPWHLIGPRPLRLCSGLNAGFILMKKEKYDLDFIEWILGRYRDALARFTWWADQTIWGAMAARCSTRLISTTDMLLMRPGTAIDSSAVAGHFVSTYRYLLKDFDDLDCAPGIGAFRTEPAKRCTATGLLREIAIARLSRIAAI